MPRAPEAGAIARVAAVVDVERGDPDAIARHRLEIAHHVADARIPGDVDALPLRCRLSRELGSDVAINAAEEDPVEAVKGSDLIFLATPVGAIIDLIERIGPIVSPQTLITDVGSTKQQILERARVVFGARASQRFLGGHPMAGKEHGSIFWAEPGLFRGAVWLLVSAASGGETESPAIAEYRQLLERIGAHVTPLEAERHDRLCAWISHLPQMISTALAGTLVDEFGDDPELHAIVIPEIAQEAAQLWKYGEVLHMSGAGHNIHRDRYDETMTPVRDFLSRT